MRHCAKCSTESLQHAAHHQQMSQDSGVAELLLGVSCAYMSAPRGGSRN